MNDKMTTPIETTSAQHPDYRGEIAELIRSNLAPKLMRDRILEYHENDIAAALELLKKEERNRVYNVLDSETLAEILSYAEHMDEYMLELGMRKRAEILSNLEPAELPTTCAAPKSSTGKPSST